MKTVTGPDPDGPGGTSPLITNYDYDAVGNVVAIDNSAGQLQTFVYNKAGKLVGFF
jgi:YD repeat-containing protein